MDATDDDFGDLYADVEVAASSAINGVLEPSNLSAKDEKDEIFKSPECLDDEFEENVSDSEDDFDIVLNDDDCDGLEISRMRNGDEEANEGKEVGDAAKDGSEKSRMCLDSVEGFDRRNVAKVVNSQYKVVYVCVCVCCFGLVESCMLSIMLCIVTENYSFDVLLCA